MVPASAESQLQAGIAKLRDGFLDRVAERVMVIDAILAASKGPEVADVDRRMIAHHAHKTAGVAATFGFVEMGALAAQVEQMMANGEATIAWDSVRPKVESLLDSMEDALDA